MKIKHIKILINTDATDIINFYPDLPTAFPRMGYEPVMKMETQSGLAISYVEENFPSIAVTILDLKGNKSRGKS